MTMWKPMDMPDTWTDGTFKIAKYEPMDRTLPKVIYCAYFKPEGWKNFGNRINASVEYYPTMKDAKEACQRFDPAEAKHH